MDRKLNLRHYALASIYIFLLPYILYTSITSASPKYSLEPIWRKTWGDYKKNHRVYALFSYKDSNSTFIIAITDKNMLKLDIHGNITKNLQLVNNHFAVNDVLQMSSGQVLILYTSELTLKYSNKLLIIDPSKWTIEKSLPIDIVASNMKIAEDKKNLHFILSGTSLGNKYERKSVTFHILDSNFNVLHSVPESTFALNAPLQKTSHLFFDELEDTVIALSSSTYNEKNYVDSIIVLNKNLTIKNKSQHNRTENDNTASGFRYIRTQATNSSYVILTTTEHEDGGCCQQNIITLDKNLNIIKKYLLMGSARYGSELTRTDQNSFLITSESMSGRGFFAEVDSQGDILYQWISHNETNWSPATASVKLDDGYIIALETAFSEKHQEEGTRGIVFTRLIKSNK